MIERPLPPPEEDENAPRPSPYLAILLAGVLAMAVFAALFMVIGPMVFIPAGIFGLAFLHYIVWGWWLSKLIKQDVEQEERH